MNSEQFKESGSAAAHAERGETNIIRFLSHLVWRCIHDAAGREGGVKGHDAVLLTHTQT